MTETYGQRFRITWTAYVRGKPRDEGSVVVKPLKPSVVRGVVVKLRSQALNGADKWLRKNKPTYATADAWALRIEPIEEDE